VGWGTKCGDSHGKREGCEGEVQNQSGAITFGDYRMFEGLVMAFKKS
jgi:hypothetical protein